MSKSLADMMVSTLAEIQRMDDGIDTNSPERHAVWQLQRVAEQAIAEGLRIAMEMTDASRNVREAVAAASQPNKTEGA